MDCTNKKSALGGAGDHAKHGGGGIGDSRYFAGLSDNNGSQDKHGVTASQSFKVAMTSERPVRTGSDIFFAHLDPTRTPGPLSLFISALFKGVSREHPLQRIARSLMP